MNHYLQLTGRFRRSCATDDEPVSCTEQTTLDLAATSLLLIDVYEGVQEGEDVEGTSGAIGAQWQSTVHRIATGLEAARAAALPVVYAVNSAPRIALARSEFGAHFQRSWCTEFDHAYREGGVDPREYHSGRSGTLSFPAELEPQPGDFYIRKHVYSAFFDTRLDSLLRNLRVRNLVMAGFWADTCVLASSLDAFYRDYRVVWLRDGTLGDEAWAIPWFEITIGHTVTAVQSAAACQSAAATKQAGQESSS